MSCLIAAPCSGSGKTLLSLSLAAVARARRETIQPFKVGPDYLDPQLLGAVAGRPCRNLDPLLCGEDWVRRSYRWHGGRADRVLVEGVMGLFDGRGSGSEGSSAAVAALLALPVVLVVEASRQAGSLAALVRGFRDHGPPRVTLAGVVLNRVGSERHRRLLAEALAAIEVPLLGVLPSHPSLELPSRHLGLLTPGELGDLGERQKIWAALAEQHLDLAQLWPLLAPPPPAPERRDPIRWCLDQVPPEPVPAGAAAGAALGQGATGAGTPLPVAIASDAAFHFRYPEAQELLQACGLSPVPWSPLADDPLPPDCRAVLLPGGYPELHAARLAASHRSLGSLRSAARGGLPIVAECGGLLLLGRELEDPDGLPHPMAGLLPFRARRGPLSLGYRQAVPVADGLLVRRGESLCGHEFHRWQLLPQPSGGELLAEAQSLWQLEGWGSPGRIEGWSAPTVHATWLHLHWAGCPAIPSRLARSAASAVPLPRNAASCNPVSG
ncbi:cobyrinate a,c-diamide synthase [Cyanobium gracile UHCC 0139]|uniref:Cobyrinate a,c-diamide synthase n=1 Tax=Cyanobium gracile UHCC 0139 TaxID=3110308 RepID=A0ABU5RRA6_9CYAN|nr:cobyrinate a,c-diamide synthase [Cyanobium gracile]MEA5390314.1 cobyrinate a,c-diamide synthase [Cyanobium gracile UHCC 0139]